MYGVILLGSPGAGKGTIGSHLHLSYQLNHFSSGDLLRDEVQKGSDFGQEIKSTVEEGRQVENSLITNLVLNKLQKMIDTNKSFVLDGFPQTPEQKESLDEYVTQHPELKLHYICVIVEREAALDRMQNRLSCGKCHKIYTKIMFPKKSDIQCTTCFLPLRARESDQIEKASIRLDIFSKTTEKLIETLVDPLVINGNLSSEEVKQQVDSIMLTITNS